MHVKNNICMHPIYGDVRICVGGGGGEGGKQGEPFILGGGGQGNKGHMETKT